MSYTLEEKARGILKLCPGIDIERFAVKMLGCEAFKRRGKKDGKQLSVAARNCVRQLQKEQVIEVIKNDLYPNGVIYLYGQAPKPKRLNSTYKPLECKVYSLDDLPTQARAQSQSQPTTIRRSIDWDKAARLEHKDRKDLARESRIKLVKKDDNPQKPERPKKDNDRAVLAAAETNRERAAAKLQKALELIEEAANHAIATRQPMPRKRDIALSAGYSESWLQRASAPNGRNRDMAAIAYEKALERVQAALGHELATPLPQNSRHEAVIRQIEVEKQKAIANGTGMTSRLRICEIVGVSPTWFHTNSRAAKRGDKAYRQAFRDVQEANQNRKSA